MGDEMYYNTFVSCKVTCLPSSCIITILTAVVSTRIKEGKLLGSFKLQTAAPFIEMRTV